MIAVLNELIELTHFEEEEEDGDVDDAILDVLDDELEDDALLEDEIPLDPLAVLEAKEEESEGNEDGDGVLDDEEEDEEDMDYDSFDDRDEM